MPISFNDFFKRALEASGAKTQMELAAILGINRSAITQAKNRNAVPDKWLLSLSRKFAVSPDWLEHGDKYQKNILKPVKLDSGLQAAASESVSPARLRSSPGFRPDSRHVEPEGDYSEIISIPKISAVLCAGGGSFEVDANIIEHVQMPLPMAHSLGSPANLVFMDVSGDSMEPGIFNGDTVLIDQSVRNFQPNSVMAVGHDDTIFIKRLASYSDGSLGLLSDNPAYEPIRLYGDEMESFRILGKLVWLCRKVM